MNQDEIKRVNLEDITFIIQGKICNKDKYHRESTKHALKTIRKNFKKSQIILSTWEGEDVSGLEYDKVIFNKDPGALSYLRKSA